MSDCGHQYYLSHIWGLIWLWPLCVWACMYHNMHGQIKELFVRVSSFLLPHGAWISNVASRLAPLHAGPSHWISQEIFFLVYVYMCTGVLVWSACTHACGRRNGRRWFRPMCRVKPEVGTCSSHAVHLSLFFTRHASSRFSLAPDHGTMTAVETAVKTYKEMVLHRRVAAPFE